MITDSFYQTFPLQYLNIAKHRKKIPDGLIKTTQPEKIKVTRKSEPILLKSFFEAMKGPHLQILCRPNWLKVTLYKSDKFSRCYNKRIPLHFFTEQLEAHALNNYMRGPGHYPRKA